MGENPGYHKDPTLHPAKLNRTLEPRIVAVKLLLAIASLKVYFHLSSRPIRPKGLTCIAA